MAESKSPEVQRMMQQVSEIHGGMGAVLDLLEKIVQQLAQPAKPTDPPVASPQQLYPALHGTPVTPAPRRPVGWWGRAFPTRAPHE